MIEINTVSASCILFNKAKKFNNCLSFLIRQIFLEDVD